MNQKFHAPTLIADVTGPNHTDFTPMRAFAIVHRETVADFTDTRRVTREDVATLALIYASHFSAIHVPFQVNRDCIYSMEEQGFIKATWYGTERANIEVINA